MSVAPPARMAKMQPPRVDLRGLSLDEAMAKVREQINAAQEEWLAGYELAMTDIGGDAADQFCRRAPACRACAVARSGHREDARTGGAWWKRFAVKC